MSGFLKDGLDEINRCLAKPAPENAAVGRLSELLAVNVGYSTSEAANIRMAAYLHDCGKSRIPKSILDKPGKLTAREYEIVKRHTVIGQEMLSCLRGGFGEMARNVALNHHEQWDGRGYWGKPGRALPPYVGIVAICDVLAALLNSRAYKPPWPPDEALAYIKSRAGTQFCPGLAEIFVSLVIGDSRVPAIFMGTAG